MGIKIAMYKCVEIACALDIRRHNTIDFVDYCCIVWHGPSSGSYCHRELSVQFGSVVLGFVPEHEGKYWAESRNPGRAIAIVMTYNELSSPLLVRLHRTIYQEKKSRRNS